MNKILLAGVALIGLTAGAHAMMANEGNVAHSGPSAHWGDHHGAWNYSYVSPGVLMAPSWAPSYYKNLPYYYLPYGYYAYPYAGHHGWVMDHYSYFVRDGKTYYIARVAPEIYLAHPEAVVWMNQAHFADHLLHNAHNSPMQSAPPAPVTSAE